MGKCLTYVNTCIQVDYTTGNAIAMILGDVNKYGCLPMLAHTFKCVILLKAG